MKHKTVWVVWFFIAMLAVALPLPLIVNVALPMTAIAYAVMMVVSGYTGLDMAASFNKSLKLPAGYKYTGSIKKLFAIVIGMCILMLEAVTLQAFLPDVALPLEQIVTAAGLVAGLYAGGSKALNIAEAQGANS